jgi:hypothetical protein
VKLLNSRGFFQFNAPISCPLSECHIVDTGPLKKEGTAEPSDSVLSRQLLEFVPIRKTDVVDISVRLEVAKQAVDFVFEIVLRRSLSEIVFVEVIVAEQEETVGAVAAAVGDQKPVTAEVRRRDVLCFLGVEVVAVAGDPNLEVVGGEPRRAGFVEVLHIDLRLSLGKEFIVVFPENRSVRCDPFEPLPVEMVDQLACELVESIEVAVEVIATVVLSTRSRSRSRLSTRLTVLR